MPSEASTWPTSFGFVPPSSQFVRTITEDRHRSRFYLRLCCPYAKQMKRKRYPVLGTVQSALHFTPGRPVHSNANSASPGSTGLRPRCNFGAYTIRPPLLITMFSFIQLSELEQRGVNEIAQASKQGQENFSFTAGTRAVSLGPTTTFGSPTFLHVFINFSRDSYILIAIPIFS